MTLRDQVETALRDYDPTPRQNDPTWQEMADAAITVVLAAVAERIEGLPTRTVVDDEHYTGGKRPWPIAVDRYRDEVLAVVRGADGGLEPLVDNA